MPTYAKSIFLLLLSFALAGLPGQAVSLPDEVDRAEEKLELLEEGSLERTFLRDMDFSPDDKILAVSYANRPPAQVAVASGRILNVLGYSPDEELKRRELSRRLRQDPTIAGAERVGNGGFSLASNSLLRRVNDINAITYSPDGKQVAGAGAGVLKLYDAQSGREEQVISITETAALTHAQDPQYFVSMVASMGGSGLLGGSWGVGSSSVEYSQDGKLVAVCQPYGCSVRSSKDGKEVYGFHHSDRMGGRYFARFSPEGKELAVVCQTTGMERSACRLDILDAQSGKILRTYQKRWPYGDLRWSQDGKRLAFFTVEGKLVELDSADFRELAVLPGGDRLSFSPDGRYLVVSDREEGARIMEVMSGKIVKRFYQDFPDAVRGIKARPVAWSHDGKTIAVGGEEYMVYFWDVGALKQ